MQEKIDFWNRVSSALDLQHSLQFIAVLTYTLFDWIERWDNKLLWSTFDKLESRKLDGWEIVYEIDEKNRTKYKLVIKDKSILIVVHQELKTKKEIK